MTRTVPELHAQQPELEAYLALGDRLGLRRGLPFSRNWSAAPDFLALIADHVLATKPETIVECSSGLTTLMLARCCDLNGAGHVFSLENGPEFAENTRAEIVRYGLEKQATVIDAPLIPCMLNEREYQWYDLADLPDCSIDMLVIDGPPGFLQRHSRYPALPLLFDKLTDDCIVFMDDAARPDEREIIEMWRSRFSAAIQHEFVGNTRGCSILRMQHNRPGANASG